MRLRPLLIVAFGAFGAFACRAADEHTLAPAEGLTPTGGRERPDAAGADSGSSIDAAVPPITPPEAAPPEDAGPSDVLTFSDGNYPDTEPPRIFDGSLAETAPPLPSLCSGAVSRPCQQFCSALSEAPSCQFRLEIALSGFDPEVDGGIDEPRTSERLLEACECDCEKNFAYQQCKSDFADYISCGGALATVEMTCPVDPDALPIVIGPSCGTSQITFSQCLEQPRLVARPPGDEL
ncbi:MAG: hypothetical protein HRU17_12400 [Polyangiaceae bacterium]|nr:hypothetical protein [Polyangiaceae bacterium]